MKILFLALVCFLTCLPTLGSEFKLDDFDYIDPAMGRHYSSIMELFTQSNNLHYNPLNNLFNDVLFALLGHQHAWPFHLLNIVLLFLNGVLLYKIALLLTRSEMASFFAAVLFCLHPINAEITNQIVFNTVLLSALFFQLAVVFFDQYLSRPNKQKMLAILFVSLVSTLILETSMILPLYFLLWAYFARGKNLKDSAVLTLPFWALSGVLFLVWFFVTLSSASSGGIMAKSVYLGLTILNFSGTLISLIFWYCQKLIVPVGHVWIYGVEPLDIPTSAFYLFVAIAVAAAGYLFRRRIFASRMVNLALLWFCAGFMFLLPGSFAHPEAGLVIEPYWFYVSSMGFFILIGLGLVNLKEKIGKVIFLCLIGSLCFILALLTQRFNVIAKTQKSYSEYWLQTSLNATPLTALAKMAYMENNYALAAQYYELYLKRFSWSPYCKDRPDVVYTTLGAVYLDMGDMVKARAMTAEALKINPRNPKPHIVYGMISVNEKDYETAERHFQSAIALDQMDTLSRFNLVDLYVTTQQYKKAIAALEELVKMNNLGQDRNKVLAKLDKLKRIEGNK